LSTDDRFCEQCGTGTRKSSEDTPASAPAEPNEATDTSFGAEPAIPGSDETEPLPAEPAPAAAAHEGPPASLARDEFIGSAESANPAWVAEDYGGVASNVGGAITAALQHPASFFVAYVILAIPTYVLPYFGSNSTLLNTTGVALGVGALPQYWLHLTFLYALAALAWLRGGLIGRSWLPVLPVLAGIFDMTPGLNWFPLIPSGFHVATLIIGVTKDPLEGVDVEAQRRRPLLALIGLVLMVLLSAYKWTAYNSAVRRSLQENLGALGVPAQPASDSEAPAADVPPVAVQAPPEPTLNVGSVTIASAAAGANLIGQADELPAGPVVVKFDYTGADVGTSYTCQLGSFGSWQGNFASRDGWVTCTWPQVPPGRYDATMVSDGKTQASREVVVTPSAPTASISNFDGKWTLAWYRGASRFGGTMNVKGASAELTMVQDSSRVREDCSITRNGATVIIQCSNPVRLSGIGGYNPDSFQVSALNANTLQGQLWDATGPIGAATFTRG
jgi:hypothetical protein